MLGNAGTDYTSFTLVCQHRGHGLPFEGMRCFKRSHWALLKQFTVERHRNLLELLSLSIFICPLLYAVLFSLRPAVMVNKICGY